MEIVFWGVTAALAALGLIELVRMLVFWLTAAPAPRRPHPGAFHRGEGGLRAAHPGRVGPAPVDGLGPLPLGVRQQEAGPPGGGDLQSVGAALSPADPLQNPGFGVSYTAERSSRLAAMGEVIWQNRESALLELSGSVEHVIYHNDKNQYTVLELAAGGGPGHRGGGLPLCQRGGGAADLWHLAEPPLLRGSVQGGDL